MSNQKYNVNHQIIDSLLGWVKSGEIAIPEIQRPFVWTPVKVRNLMDSLYQGFPVGYIITWLNPNVKLKDGTMSLGKKILIDGQQRVTALRAAMMGEMVLDDEYNERRIRIAFHPEACKEVLKRLLQPNHERNAEEVAAGLHDKKGVKKEKKVLKAKAGSNTGELFGEETF